MKEKLVWVSILAVAAFTSLALATTNETESDRAGKGKFKKLYTLIGII
jgi:hypothetical protein